MITNKMIICTKCKKEKSEELFKKIINNLNNVLNVAKQVKNGKMKIKKQYLYIIKIIMKKN